MKTHGFPASASFSLTTSSISATVNCDPPSAPSTRPG